MSVKDSFQSTDLSELDSVTIQLFQSFDVLIGFFMKRFYQFTFLAFGLALIGLQSGCGESLEVSEVTGIVTLNGKPLDLVHVEFWPNEGPRSFGKTDEQGRFTLETDDRTQKGAVPGKHKVALRDMWPMKDDYLGDGGEWVDMSKGKRSRIDSKYYDAPMSPVSVEVMAGKANTFDFPVDTNPQK